MSSPAADHDHETPAPVTDRMHETSWSANLEKPAHAANPAHVIEGAIEAIEHTEPGNHVNLVSHGDHGHPGDYLYPALEEVTWDRDLEFEYVEQCGCGGHVTRVYVE
jgi:putative CGCGG family rSAM target protein